MELSQVIVLLGDMFIPIYHKLTVKPLSKSSCFYDPEDEVFRKHGKRGKFSKPECFLRKHDKRGKVS